MYSILEDTQKRPFRSGMELDFASHHLERFTFRGNLVVSKTMLVLCVPCHSAENQTVGALKSAIVGSFAHLPEGLVLVTGPTGSGKSTTLAAIIDQINRTKLPEHILTVEDPIEFVHQHRRCVVNQREVGRDTKEYNVALKHALRQDPDVILIGEMRDLETISITSPPRKQRPPCVRYITTQSAKDTVSRVIDVFRQGSSSRFVPNSRRHYAGLSAKHC